MQLYIDASLQFRDMQDKHMVTVKTMFWEEISFILLYIFRENKLLKVLLGRKKDLPFLFKMYVFFSLER